MDLHKIFHMKGGHGETSYSQNSSLQKKAADKVNPITCKAIENMYMEIKPKSLGIADLGCSSGPNTLSNIKQLVHTIQKASRNINQSVPELRIYLNDLPTNDFNTIFQALPDLYKELKKGKCHDDIHDPPVYIAGYPGTFYGRLFPDNYLHFVYSSNSLHWLSKVPPGIFDENGESMNKKSVYITEKTPIIVSDAYLNQFQEDFSLFLRSRSEELVPGGRMVLILLGRSGSNHIDRGNSLYWEILRQSLEILVIQGEVEEKEFDSYDVHFYAPSKEELEDEVRKEGSFKIEQIDMFEIEKDSGNYSSYGTAVAKAVRSIQESMLIHHFGVAILEKLFDLYGKLVDEELAKKDINAISIVVVLNKI